MNKIKSILIKYAGPIILSSTILTSCERLVVGGEVKPTKVSYKAFHHVPISDAYIPYDPAHGIYGFFRWLEGETYTCGKKIYATDLHGKTGFMINLTDPDATIRIFKWPPHGRLVEVEMTLMELTDSRRVIFVNNGWYGEGYHRLLIFISSPHPDREFSFYLMGFPN